MPLEESIGCHLAKPNHWMFMAFSLHGTSSAHESACREGYKCDKTVPNQQSRIHLCESGSQSFQNVDLGATPALDIRYACSDLLVFNPLMSFDAA